jgi:hypothetical protein
MKQKKVQCASHFSTFREALPVALAATSGRRILWFAPVLIHLRDTVSGSFEAIQRRIAGRQFWEALIRSHQDLAVQVSVHIS